MRPDDDQRLASLEGAVQAIGQAWAKGDVAAAAELLSPSYSHNDAFGAQWSSSQWLAYASNRKDRATQIAFRDVQTRIFDDIAIITGFNDVTGTGATGADDTQGLTIVFTQVWRWDGGRWLREAFQATPVVPRTFD